ESDESTIDITGSESGSTFVITGGRSSGGTYFIAAETFSRTSLAASLMSRSSTNLTVTCALPSAMRIDDISSMPGMLLSVSSMPEMQLSVSSIGSTPEVAISPGLAPGSASEMFTVAGSARGNRSTPRSRNEKIPSTTSDITSIVAKTGRRTQSSESIYSTTTG